MKSTFAYRQRIGVLGGMGPAATIDFMAKIVAATPADVDQDHVPLVVHHVPQIPDRSASIEAGSDAPFLPMLAGVLTLERSGVEYIAIPCNTAHFWHARLSRHCGVPILHIADAVAAAVRAAPLPAQRMALMATRGTIAARIYQDRLEAVLGQPLAMPDEAAQRLIDEAIAAVKGGAVASAALVARQAVEHLAAAGAGCALLACTELPLALAGTPPVLPCLDATDALARACVAASLGASGGAARRELVAG